MENKKYKRTGDVNSDIFIIDKVEQDTVKFTNGATCTLKTLITDFTEITGTVNEIKNETSEIKTASDILSETNKNFSDDAHNDILHKQLLALKNGNDAPVKTGPSRQETKSVDLTAGKPITVGKAPSDFENRFKNDLEKYESAETDTYPNNMENNLLNRNGTQEKHSVKPEPPEFQVFNRIKKTEEITINIPITIKLPTAQKIDTINDMFETTLIEFLAKQYIKKNFTDNPKIITDLISNGIDSWVYKEITGRDKPVEEEIKEEEKEAEVKEKKEVALPATNNAVDKAFGFNKPQKQWDGNISKLIHIETEKQYNAVKASMEKINNIDSPIYMRYDGMVTDYEINNM